MDFNKIFRSKAFKRVLIGLGAFIVLILVFGVGLAMGFKKAGFSYRWGENYHRNFAGPRGGFFQDMAGRDFIDSHGVIGQIIKIELPTLVIDGKKDAEKIIMLKNDTVIKRDRDTISPNDLKVDDQIIIIGSPNEAGQIEAKLIRVMPRPPRDIQTQINSNSSGTIK